MNKIFNGRFHSFHLAVYAFTSVKIYYVKYFRTEIRGQDEPVSSFRPELSVPEVVSEIRRSSRRRGEMSETHLGRST